MAKGSKLISSKAFPGGGAKGGSGKMFGKQTAGPQGPGVTQKNNKGSGGRWGKGGSGHMFGKQMAGKMPSGRTGK